MSMSTNFSISFSPSTKKIYYFLFSPLLSHHSLEELWIVLIFLVRTLSSFYLYHPLKKPPIAKPAEISLVSGIPKFVIPSVSIL
jgi:hypothetical protein